MANSKLDFHKDQEKRTEQYFNPNTYIVVRVDGVKFHQLSAEHNFHKPNDKRALDLMNESAKNLMKSFKGHIPLAYGYSDEYSFLIRCSSNLLKRRAFKIASILPVAFATFYNSNWDKYFSKPSLGSVTKRKTDAWFDAKPREYSNYQHVIDYFKWRQIDCHINNLYNTTLHCLTGKYVRHELVPVGEEITGDGGDLFRDGQAGNKLFTLTRSPLIADKSKLMSSQQATQKLTGTVSAQKHDIMFLDFGVNYNNELEQFKKGTVILDTQKNFDGVNPDMDSFREYYIDITKHDTFWTENSHIFDDYILFNK